MKYILILACAVLTACGQSTNYTFPVLSGKPGDTNMEWISITNLPTMSLPTELTICDPAYLTNICWYTELDNSTNAVNLRIVTNVVTEWMTIERKEGQRGTRVKQIGLQVTNQVLTVIAYDKTNDLTLRELDREEWPSQKRVVVVPNQQNARPR